MSHIEGLDELVADWHRECAALDTELARGAMKAAGEGVDEAKANHPYTDRTHNLTDTSHVNPLSEGDCEMVWPMPYAALVDEGSPGGRNKPYPFTPAAKKKATSELDDNSERATQTLCDTINGKYG